MTDHGESIIGWLCVLAIPLIPVLAFIAWQFTALLLALAVMVNVYAIPILIVTGTAGVLAWFLIQGWRGK